MDLGSAHGRIQFLYDPNGIARAKSDLEGLGRAGNDVSQQMTRVGGAMLGVGGAISAGVGLATNSAANFEQALANIASVGGKEAVERMDEISDKALELGAETSFSAMEAAAGMEELIKAGLPLDDVLNGAAASALQLSEATGTAVPESAELMATALNVFGEGMTGFSTEADKATHIADLFAQAANASATDVHELGLAFRQSATVADMFGISVDDLSTGLAILADNGLKGSDAGTSLKQMLLSLTNQTKPAREELAALGLTFDDFYDSTGQFVGIEQMFDTLRTSMAEAGYTSQDVQDALAQLFGSDAIRAADIFFGTNEEGWAEMRTGMADAGTAAEQAAIRMDTFKGAAEKLAGSIETALIAFGTPLLGGIRKTTEGITELVNAFINLDPGIQAVIAKSVALTGTLLGIGGTALIAGGYFVRLAQALGLSQAAALRLVGAFGALTALGAIAGAAYITNFLGFRDAVNALAGEIVSFGKTVADTFSKKKAAGMNTMAAGLAAIGEGLFWTENPALMELGKIFDNAAIGAQAFGDEWQRLTSEGVNPATAAFQAASAALTAMGLPDQAQFMADLGEQTAKFASGFEAAFFRGQEAGLNNVANAVQAFGDALLFTTGIDITGFTDRISAGIQSFGDAFQNALETGLNPFEAGLEGLKGALEGITGIDISGLADELGFFAGSMRTVLGAMLDGNFQDAFDALGIALRSLGDSLGPEIQNALNNIGAAITSIDLGEIAVNVAGWIQGRWEDLKSWLDTNVLDRIPAIDLAEVAVNIATWIAGKIADLGEAIQQFISGDDGDQRHAEGGGVNLGQIRANIESWLVEQRENLSTVIQTTVDRAISALGTAGAAIGQVVATVQSWLVEQALPLATEITNKAKEFAGNVIASIPQVVANIVSWAVEGIENLATAIQNAVGGSPNGGGSFRGSPGLSVTIASITATITQFVADAAGALATFVTDLTNQIVTAVKTIPVPQVIAQVGTIVWDVAAAIANGLADLAAKISGAVSGHVIQIGGGGGRAGAGALGTSPVTGGGVTVQLQKVTFDPGPAEPDLYTQVDTWGADVKNNIFDTINKVMNQDPGGTLLDFGDLGGLVANALEDALTPVFDAIGGTIEEGGRNMITELDNFLKETTRISGLIIDGLIALPAGLALFGFDFVTTALGVEINLHEAGDRIKGALDDFMALFSDTQAMGMSEMAPGGGNPFLAGAGDRGPFAFFEDLLTSAQETIDNFITGMEEIGTRIQGMTNPFEPLIQNLQSWIDQFQHDFQNLIFGFSAEGGGSFRGGHGGIAQTFIDSITGMFEGIGPSLRSALDQIPNPLEEVGNWLQDQWSKITSWDVGGLAPKDVGATGVGEGGLNPATMGEDFGAALADAFSSPAFADGLSLAMENVDSTLFMGVGDALMAKISEGLQGSLSGAGAAAGAPEHFDPAGPEMAMVSSLQAMFTGMVQPLIGAVQALDIAIFQPVGAALMAKIQEGLTAAISASQGGGGQGALGTAPVTGGAAGFGAQMVQSVVTSMTTAITAADFSAVTTGFSEKLGTALDEVATSVDTKMLAITQAFSNGAISIGTALTQINTTVTTQFATMQTAVDAGVTGLQASIQALVPAIDSIAAAVGLAMTNMNTTITSTFTQMQATVDSSVSALQASFQALIPAIDQIAAAVGTALMNMTTTITSAFAEMQAQVDAAVSGIQASVQAIVPALEGVATAAGIAAGSIGDAIVAALDADLAAVQSSAAALGAAATVPIQSAIQPGSPSKVVMPWAESIPEALVTALNAGEAPVIQSVTTLMDNIMATVNARIQQIIQSVTELSSKLSGELVTSTNQATESLTELAGPTMEQAGAGLTDAAATGVTNADLCTPIQEKMTSAADCATQTMEASTPAISESMGTTMTNAAEGATPAAEAAGTTLGTAVGEAAGTEVSDAGAQAGDDFGTRMVEAMRSKMSDASAAGEGIGQTAIQAILGTLGQADQSLTAAGQSAGQALGSGITTAIDSTVTAGMNNTAEKVRQMADNIRAMVEERVANLRSVQDTWMSKGQDMVAHRNANVQMIQANDNRPIHIRITSELDGEVLDDRIVETAIGPMMSAFERVGNRRMGATR